MGSTESLARRPYALSPHNSGLVASGGRLRGPRRTQVLIVGGGLFRDEAPLDDPRWEVWALNACAPIDREGRLRADLWFDLHQREAQSADDLDWIRTCPVPLCTTPDLMGEPRQPVRYPLAEIEAEFGGYWACTFAYQVALALYEDYATDLGLFGVELMYGTMRERTVEWACLSYWLGRAEERGLRLHLPARSMLCHHVARYGFDYRDELEQVREYTSGAPARDERAVWEQNEPPPCRFHGQSLAEGCAECETIVKALATRTAAHA